MKNKARLARALSPNSPQIRWLIFVKYGIFKLEDIKGLISDKGKLRVIEGRKATGPF